ncbi:MAG: hypothetical protein RL071_4461 [Pseudomonadota bacterium]|jgi:spermidine synthase
MRAWDLLGTGEVPGSEGVMDLYRRGDELAIRVNGRELMNNKVHGSEDALADLVCDRLGDQQGLRLLVGGLGMGFTLAAALRRVGPTGEVTVAELVPVILEWNRGPLGHVAGHPLDDPRARVHAGDVAEAIREKGPWDGVLLDVDNGPKGLTRKSNDWLYGWHGLEAARQALRPGGWLAIWSAAPDDAFTKRLQRAGFEVEVAVVRARQGGGGGHRHTIWLAQRGDRPAGAPPEAPRRAPPRRRRV